MGNLENEEAARVLRERLAEVEHLKKQLQYAISATHARVKSTFGILAALIDMSLQNGTERIPDSALVQMMKHLRALESIYGIQMQEIVIKGDPFVVSVKRVLECSLPRLRSNLGARNLVMYLDELYLPIAQATTLTMIANELLSNAIKHGQGHVELVLRAEENRATLEVWDDGPGFPEGFDPESIEDTSLGFITNRECLHLHAEISFKNRPEGGAHVVLTFPIQRSILE